MKNKADELSDSKNYKPIVIATITSKLFESVLLLKCSDYLITCDNHFRFKASHGMDMCLYTREGTKPIPRTRNIGYRVNFKISVSLINPIPIPSTFRYNTSSYIIMMSRNKIQTEHNTFRFNITE